MNEKIVKTTVFFVCEGSRRHGPFFNRPLAEEFAANLPRHSAVAGTVTIESASFTTSIQAVKYEP